MLDDDLEYLRECLEQLTRPSDSWSVEMSNLGINLARREAMILHYLMERSPQVVPVDAIMLAVYWDRRECDWPDGISVIRVLIHRIRKKLAGIGLGEIKSMHGAGYSWVPAEERA